MVRLSLTFLVPQSRPKIVVLRVVVGEILCHVSGVQNHRFSDFIYEAEEGSLPTLKQLPVTIRGKPSCAFSCVPFRTV